MEQGSSWGREQFLFGVGAKREGLGGIRQGDSSLLPLLLGMVAALTSGVAKLRGKDGAHGQGCPSACQPPLQGWDTSEGTGDRQVLGSQSHVLAQPGITRSRDSPRCAGDQ